MSNSVLPDLPGLKWGQKKTPVFSTRIQRTTSGREARAAFYQYPIYVFDLSYEVLRDDTLHNELKQLLGFYLTRQGAFDSFLYQDPSDYQASNQVIGTGDGNTVAFQMVRNYGAGNAIFVEPILNVQAPVVSGNELMINGGISLNTAGWNADGNCTIASIAGDQSGNCLEVTRTGGSEQHVTQWISGLVIGKSYRGTGFVKSGNSGNEAFRFDITNGNGIGATAVQGGNSNASWGNYSVSFVADEANKGFTAGKMSSTAGTMLFDTFSLQAYTIPLNIYVAGNLQQSGNYSVNYLNSGILTFNSAPTNGAVISADFSYYYRVRFAEYSSDLDSPGGGGEAFSQFMKNLWENKSMTLVTCR